MASKNVKHENETAPRKGSRKKLFVILGGAVLLLGALAAFFLWLRAYTYVYPIDLNGYVKAVCQGYDGAGEAEAVFDREAFLTDYAGKLRWKNRSDRAKGDPAEALADAVTAYLVAKEDLENGEYSNGDVLRLRWKNKNFRKRIANAEISMDTLRLSVEGLTAPGTFDAFAALEIVADGLDGEGRIVKLVEHSGLKYKYDLDYQVMEVSSDDGQLKNGDTVTVSIGGKEKERDLIRSFGMKPEQMEKSFTVEGLVTYTFFDPFRDLRLTFTGRNGEGILQKADNLSPLPASQKLGFTFEPNRELRNGDQVRVKVVFGPVKREQMAKEYGMLPGSLEKTFVVSGLQEDGAPDEGPDPGDSSDDQEDDMENVFGKVDGNVYENVYFNLRAALPSAFSVYGKGQIPSSVIGGLNDLYAEAGQQENIGVRIQKLTEEEKTKSAREILEAYAQEIFSVYKENGAKTSHSYSEVTFAGETCTCLDITASIFIVVKIRHRIFIRKEGDYAVAISVMAGNEQKLSQYCALFQRLK